MSAAVFKRSSSKRAMQPVCPVCGSEFALDVARRSQSWWSQIEGVRMLLCPDPSCLDAWERHQEQGGRQ